MWGSFFSNGLGSCGYLIHMEEEGGLDGIGLSCRWSQGYDLERAMFSGKRGMVLVMNRGRSLLCLHNWG